MKPEANIKVAAVYNSEFGQWRLCHDAWCEKGETSVVATMTISLTGDDEAWAKELAFRFNTALDAYEAGLEAGERDAAVEEK
jgi:hypothetical protein